MFEEVDLKKLEINPFSRIGNDWMLITAGNIDKWNTMTASWGGLGVLWGRNVSFIFVRPSRYTFEFTEAGGEYTLSWFDENWRKALNLCGSRSGRDTDKAAETGLIPFGDEKYVGFEQAQMIMQCRKLYSQEIDPERFLDAAIEKNYHGSDYHTMYVGEITNCLIRRN